MFRLFVVPYLALSIFFPFFNEYSNLQKVFSLINEPQTYWIEIWLFGLAFYVFLEYLMDRNLRNSKIRKGVYTFGVLLDIIVIYMISSGTSGYLNMIFSMIFCLLLSFLFVLFVLIRPVAPIALQESLLILIIGPVLMNLIQLIYFDTWISGATLVNFTPIALMFLLLSCNRPCVGETAHRYLGDVIGSQDVFRLTVMINFYTSLLVIMNSIHTDSLR